MPSPSPTAWSEVQAAGPAPEPREDHTWIVTPDDATAYLFGGRDGGAIFDDLWAFDLATDTWSLVTPAGSGPPARFGHSAAWADGIGLVVFAGQAGDDFFNDLWAYDPAANAWRSLPSSGARPVARYGSCAAIGPDGRLWISHGFTSEGQRFSDTRAYDFSTLSWTNETPAGDAPMRRCLHACWWNAADQLTLYGGQTSGVTALGDLWRLSVGPRPGTNEWQQLTPPVGLPAARNLPAAARWGAATLVIGGQDIDGGYLADGWWLADDDGAASELIAEGTPPPARSGAELIPDPDRGRVLLFGGRDGSSAFGDLWQLTLGSAAVNGN
ncbi:MAG: kelch repeat-containing protein [Chloroflexota bacterium]